MDEPNKGEIVLARRELEGYLWGTKEDGDEGDPYCVVYMEDDPDMEQLCHRTAVTCQIYPYSEWEPVDRVHPKPGDDPREEIVSHEHNRVETGGKRVPPGKIYHGATIKVTDLIPLPVSSPQNVVGRRPKPTFSVRVSKT